MSDSREIIMYLGDNQNYDEIRKFADIPESAWAKGYIPEAYYMKTENWKLLGEPKALAMTITPVTETADEAAEEGESDDGQPEEREDAEPGD